MFCPKVMLERSFGSIKKIAIQRLPKGLSLFLPLFFFFFFYLIIFCLVHCSWKQSPSAGSFRGIIFRSDELSEARRKRSVFLYLLHTLLHHPHHAMMLIVLKNNQGVASLPHRHLFLSLFLNYLCFFVKNTLRYYVNPFFSLLFLFLL